VGQPKAEMRKVVQNLIPVKQTNSLRMYYDLENEELLFEKDGVFFTLKKNEIFPASQGIKSTIQRFYRKEVK
jgi:hypothetical protein